MVFKWMEELRNNRVMKANKKGTIVIEQVIFIALNLVFFGLLLFFVFRVGAGAVVLEQAYAKEIALLIDKAEPKATYILDLEKGVKIAEKRGYEVDKIVRVNMNRNEVIVQLDENGGYRYEYFTDYGVKVRMNGNKLILNIDKKGVEEG